MTTVRFLNISTKWAFYIIVIEFWFLWKYDSKCKPKIIQTLRKTGTEVTKYKQTATTSKTGEIMLISNKTVIKWMPDLLQSFNRKISKSVIKN